jgi:hypothetical protein
VGASKKSGSHRVKGKQVVTATKTTAKPHAAAQPGVAVTIDRRAIHDRRSVGDRRTHGVPVAVERRGIERRVKVNRRRQIDPTTCERDYTSDEIEFMGAMDEYKRRSGRMFPTCSEVLEVIKSLGYAKQTRTETTVLPGVVLPVATSPSPSPAVFG